MNSMKYKENGNTVMVVVVIIAVLLLAYIAFKPKQATVPEPTPNGQTQTNTNPNGPDYYPSGNPAGGTQPALEVDGKATMNDLVSFSIIPGQEVSGKMTATGSVKNGYFFEANIVTNIVDGNKKLLRQGHGTATTDWMTSGAVSFTTTLDFTGLPSGLAYVAIQNDNASGLPENDKMIYVPVIIK